MHLITPNINSSLWVELLRVASFYPESDSIIFNDDKYCFTSLKKRANQIASELTTQGVLIGDRVGVFLPRGFDQIASFFAIVKIGAIFVPINENPKFEYIIKDSDVSMILCVSEISGIDDSVNTIILPQLNNHRVYCNMDDDNDYAICTDKDTCAIIYTSGTTENPKGVLINHRMLINYAVAANEYMNLSHEVRFALFPPIICIDALHLIVAMLFSGATLCIMSQYDVSTSESISSFLERYNITHCYVHSEMAVGIIPNSELIFFQTGGTPAKSNLCYSLPPECIFSNGYGLTEAGAFLVWCNDGTYRSQIPLGKPIRNTEVFIQNDGLLCSGDEVGELCVAGDCLSNGYVRNYEGSENRFTDNPFGDGVLLHTGDMASWNEFGEVLYMGRKNKKCLSDYTDEQLENGIMERCENCRIVIVRNDNSVYVFAQLVKNASLNMIRQALEGHFQKLGLTTNNVHVQQVDNFPFTENHKIARGILLSQAHNKG